MSRRIRIDPDAISAVEELAQRALSAEEFRSWADGEIPSSEMQDTIELIRWFVRRYPTPADRLRSARRRQVQLARTVAHVRASSVG